MASPPQDLPPDLFGGGEYIVRKIGNQIPYVFGASPVCPPSLSTCGFPATNFVQIERNLRNKMEKQSFQLRSSCTSVQRQRKYEFFGAKYEVRLRNWRF
jgi:hypothetical protein